MTTEKEDTLYEAQYVSEYVSRMSTEAQNMLIEKAKSVNLDNIGVDTTYNVPIINELEIYWGEDKAPPEQKFDRIKQWVVAQALSDNLSTTERGISLRWLMPDLDFVDSYCEHIKNREWWVPANGRAFEPDPEWTPPQAISPMYKDPSNPTDDELIAYQRYIDAYLAYSKEVQNKMRAEEPPSRRRRQTVLESNRTSDNDRKAIILFAAGLGHGSTHTITSIAIKHTNRTRLLISTEHMPDGKAVAFENAYVCKRCDNMKIVVTFPQEGWHGRRDKIILYGFVAEPLGTFQTG